MSSQVLLNGEMVDGITIDPRKHLFMGMFREPGPPISNGTWDFYQCSCGLALWSVRVCAEHWRLGHMDIPQYVDIKIG